MAEWIYEVGGAEDFKGAPEWANFRTSAGGRSYFVEGHFVGAKIWDVGANCESVLSERFDLTGVATFAIRTKVVTTSSKYNRPCKGITIDVYDVLQAFEVTNPALQHLIKKALCAGLRGHKDREQDLNEILESARRAIELESK